MNNKKELFLLIIILVIAGFLRFFNLMHDSPYFFNPDERNMANAISQFRLPAKLSEIPACIISQLIPNLQPRPRDDRPLAETINCNLNPHFFSYGQFPLYLAFASDQVIRSFWQVPAVGTRPESDPGQARMTSFSSSIFWLRFYSALSSTLTILLVYLVTNILVISHSGKRETSASRISLGSWTPARRCYASGVAGGSQDDNLGLNIGHFASLFAAFTPGLIQSAHFGTTESLLTFFFLASIYLSIQLLNTKHEARISKQYQNSNDRNSKHFDILNLFRISDFGFRILALSIAIGLALGSKLTGIFLFVPPFIVLAVRIIELFKKGKKQLIIGLFENLRIGLFLILGSILIFILSSPYNLVEPESFKSAVFGYESDVATGKYEAFYTRQFVNTAPIIFQAEKIFPYVLGWPVFVLGSIGLLFLVFELLLGFTKSTLKRITNYELRITGKNKLRVRDSYFVILTSFLIYLLPNSFLFAKWTRFMIPILPFFSIFTGYFLFVILGSVSDSRIPSTSLRINDSGHLPTDATQQALQAGARMTKKLSYLFICLLVPLSGITPGLAFMSIYTHEDSRVTASKWIYKNIPNNSYVLSETANVVDIPLGLPNNETTRLPTPDGVANGGQVKQWSNVKVISFDFYHVDENPTILFTQLLAHLEKADYIFIPSRRIFANYTKLPGKYPLVTKYYQLLFSGALGFEKVAEINSFPAIGPIKFPDEQAEETFSVFDHPVIRIYRKVKPFTVNQYSLLFSNTI